MTAFVTPAFLSSVAPPSRLSSKGEEHNFGLLCLWYEAEFRLMICHKDLCPEAFQDEG